MWGEGWGKNSCWLVIYSIVRKRHKENPEQVNGDYLEGKDERKEKILETEKSL